MKTPSRDPARWRDCGADAHALQERAALLVDAVGDVPALGPDVLARIRAKVPARRSPRARYDVVRRLPLGARLALAAALLFLSIATARGASMLWRKYFAAARPIASRASIDAPGSVAPPRSGSHRLPPATTQPASMPSPPLAVSSPTPTPTPTPTPVATRAVAASSVHRTSRDNTLAQPALAPAAPALPTVDDQPHPPVWTAAPPALREEAESHPERPAASVASGPGQPGQTRETEIGLLAQALAQLHQKNDARGALATLDRRAQLFPHGALESEAQRTRIEATLQLGDLKEALALLDDRQLSPDALGADLLIARAELRANAGRCREAAGDFSQILDRAAATMRSSTSERALYGRAVCLGRLGQANRARTDLAAYRRRFPGGRFASEVERLLGERPIETSP